MTTRFVRGDCREMLARLPANSVHCVVTSPPYWGLRDYGIPPTVWGGDAKCKHDFEMETKTGELRTGLGMAALGKRLGCGGGHKAGRVPSIFVEHGFCRRCGAWRGAHGLEPTIDLYVRNAVEVFRAVRRVLRPDGTLWLNLGDSYAANYGKGNLSLHPNGDACAQSVDKRSSSGLKPKDLCGIPWRVAFALQADGWWLRSEIIWAKPNPMPESVTDRPTKSHEQIFMLTKSARYFYDAEAVKEACSDNSHGSPNVNPGGKNIVRLDGGSLGKWTAENKANGRNKRSVWTVATAPYKGAHFATFPPKLIEPCIKAGTSERGCCENCGAPWERDVESKSVAGRPNSNSIRGNSASSNQSVSPQRGCMYSESKTIGWAPTCKCDASAVPCTVLDPFGGAGTTGLVCSRLNRNAIMIELGAKYVAMARRRIAADRKPKVTARPRRNVRDPRRRIVQLQKSRRPAATPQLRIAACRRT
jgi:DNA modification methylase